MSRGLRRLAGAVLGFVAPAHALVPGPWSDRTAPVEVRARALLDDLTLDEKLLLLHGPASPTPAECNTSATCAYVGNVASITRLDTPPINMNDGPQGFRDTLRPGTSTAWPSALAIAASWDEAAARAWGRGMGKEFYDKGANVQLGPGLCLARVPRGGRNFEYIAGEDPFLGYVLARAAVSGIQSMKVLANAKHWVLNSQETNRGVISEDADERTRFEMYYPPFEGAIEAGVGSFMCSYNKINGDYACENPETLQHDLKQTLGFKGYVMSDWGATHSPALAQGLDVEMPGASFMTPDYLKPALAAGTVTEAGLNETVLRILRPMFEVGIMDEPSAAWDWSKKGNNVTTDESVALARKLAAQSIVLLKNDRGLLPLPADKSLALIGFAGQGVITHGGGSGSVIPSYVSTPLEAIAAVASKVSFDAGTDLDAAANLAAAADYAIVFVGTVSSEGYDRVSLSLDDGCNRDKSGQCNGNFRHQNDLVKAIAQSNAKTVVVASVPGAVLMPWADSVPAILVSFLPGQQVGNAFADVLFGKVNPCARLPLTFPREENETRMTPAQWPGLPLMTPSFNYYTEGLLVGYRWYHAYGIAPLFSFGHGLSYTVFNYADLRIVNAVVSFTVMNIGRVPGAEVAQLYLSFPPESGEPPSQLKGFQKTKELGAGEMALLQWRLTRRDLSIWNTSAHAWSRVPGTFTVMVGASSQDIRLQGELLGDPLRFI